GGGGGGGGVARAGCPEPCTCIEKKYGRQLAECAYRDLQAVPAGLPANVTTLTLSANKITSLQQSSFLEVTQVQSLWLAHNEICTIEEGTFARLLHLKNIDLSHNQLADFPWGDLYNLSALQLLKMNNNQLVKLPWEGTFDPKASFHLPSLGELSPPLNGNTRWLNSWHLHQPIRCFLSNYYPISL
uniref:LRRNT domain-containing protein n=1 Tax=Terrapene triunguis TaxID=2587831 RepID=A0A674I8X0_9SAUR